MSDHNESYFEELLDKFLAGNHSDVEFNTLKKAAADNPELQNKLAAHIEARANIRVAGEKKLKQQLSENYESSVDQTIVKDLPKKPNNTFRWLAIAVSIAALLFAGFYLWPQNQPTDHIAEFLNDPPVITLRGQPADEFTTWWKKAEQLYLNKNFIGAQTHLSMLNKFPETYKANYGKILIYRGFIEVQLGDYDRAIHMLKEVPSNNPLTDETTWYLANIYLKKGDTAAAKEALNKIMAQPTHYKHKEAKEILSSLK